MADETILFADMASYSDIQRALEESLGVEAARALDAQIHDIINEGMAAAGNPGRVVKHMGDGAILRFADATGAVACAEQILLAAARHNEGVDAPIAKRLFRAGAASGPIAAHADDADISGMTISRAARMESRALAGGILIDAATYAALDPLRRADFTGPEEIAGKRDERFTGWRRQVDRGAAPPAPPAPTHAQRVLQCRRDLARLDDADFSYLLLLLDVPRGQRPSDLLPLDRRSAGLLTWANDRGNLDDLADELLRLLGTPGE